MKIFRNHKLTIEKMTLKHIDDVMEIENILYSDPWSRKSFLYEVIANQFSMPKVLLINNMIIGYVIIWTIFEEFHIANIAIHPDYQNQGFGTFLLSEILKEDKGLEYAILEVRETNLPAIHLYEKFGFTKISKRYRYYSNGENAIVMRKMFKQPQGKLSNINKLSK